MWSSTAYSDKPYCTPRPNSTCPTLNSSKRSTCTRTMWYIRRICGMCGQSPSSKSRDTLISQAAAGSIRIQNGADWIRPGAWSLRCNWDMTKTHTSLAENRNWSPVVVWCNSSPFRWARYQPLSPRFLTSKSISIDWTLSKPWYMSWVNSECPFLRFHYHSCLILLITNCSVLLPIMCIRFVHHVIYKC